MIVSDTHVHSTFSHDGSSSMEDVLKYAIKINLKHINITDHIEHIYGKTENESIANMRKYIDFSLLLKEKYKNEIYFGVGLEAAYNPLRDSESKKMLALNGLEYVIQSVHDVKGNDCYYQSHFEGRDKDEVYNEFLDEVINSFSSSYSFDAIGHLTYITRPAPYKDKTLTYLHYKLRLDKIISEMVKRDIILEFNTSTYSSVPGSLPGMDIAKAFFDAGGKRITLSSDSHKAQDLARNFEIIGKDLKNIGFKGITVKENNDYILLPF